MRMLKFGAIDFHYSIGVSIQRLGGSLDYASFTRTRRPKKQHSANRAVRRIHTRQKDLIKAAHAAHGALLSYDAGRKALLEVLSARTLLIRIQEDCSHKLFCCVYLHFRNHLFVLLLKRPRGI